MKELSFTVLLLTSFLPSDAICGYVLAKGMRGKRMFGFGRKFAPADVGATVAENAILYSEPVMLGLIKLGSIDFSNDDRGSKVFGYSLLLNTGATIIPLVLHHLRTIRFDQVDFLKGSQAFFDSFAEAYSKKLDIPIHYDFDHCVQFVLNEIATNDSYADTKTFYGNGARQSLYAEVVRFLASKTAPDRFSALQPFSQVEEEKWHHVLEAIEGLDRSYRWSIECFDFGKMKRT